MRPAISKHLANVFEAGELEEEATISKMETVQQEGSKAVKRLLYRRTGERFSYRENLGNCF